MITTKTFLKRILPFLLSASKPQSTYIREFKQQPRTPTATKTSLTKGIRAALNLIALIPSPSIHKLPAIFSGVEFSKLYRSSGKEK